MDELLKQIWPIFRAEAAEYVEALSRDILVLESDSAEQRGVALDAIRRNAHSLKGSASSLGLVVIERIAHAIEGAIEKGQRNERYAPEAVAAMLAALDLVVQ